MITNSNKKTNKNPKKKKINCLTFAFFCELFFQKKWKKNWHLNFCVNRFLKKKIIVWHFYFFVNRFFKKNKKKIDKKHFLWYTKKNEKKWKKILTKIIFCGIQNFCQKIDKIVKKLTPTNVGQMPKKSLIDISVKWPKNRNWLNAQKIEKKFLLSLGGSCRRQIQSPGLPPLSFFKTVSSISGDSPQFSLFSQLHRSSLPSVSISLPAFFLEGTGPYQVG